MALKIISLVFVLLLGVVGGSTVPPVYIFGDSTADVGNNNFLPGNTAKANFPHNGIDFPHQKATGRFSNGFNGVDFIAKTMGHLRSPPPFLSFTNTTFHKHIFKGVNFASGGSGILDSTGSTLTMRMQLKHFSTVRSNISARVGEKAADEILSKSIFIVSTGGNDLFAFFAQFGPVNTTEREKFVATLISNYEDHIKTLYNLGARKFAIIGVPNVGCCPSIRSSNPTGDCINDLNAYASEFNEATKSLMHKLSSTYKGMKHAIGSTYEVVSNIMKNPHELVRG
ncbi:GDSL esterase/lipase [Acorus calamus]|uniref:GDSL esterase/lipase n=1 Tax=Acorus calamus TaxID=4465 RepID=A0AAV9D5N5_ACOCL|nr:GDSL esterase/lipase [Acorus calamus]